MRRCWATSKAPKAPHAAAKRTSRPDLDRGVRRADDRQGRGRLLTGSLAILSEAGHSLIDLGATVMTYAAVRISGKPADEEHQYGHGKFESVSALAETALLFVLSGVVIWEAVKRLTEHEEHVVDRQCLGVRRDRGVGRRRFFPRARALAHRQTNAEPGAGGRRAAFFLRSVGFARGAGRAWRRALRPAVGGFGRRAGCRGAGLHRRLAARPPHHRHAHRHRAAKAPPRQITAVAARRARRGRGRASARARRRREDLHRS